MRQAILCALNLRDDHNFDEYLAECVSLCSAAGIEVMKTITQSANTPDPEYYFRHGKLEEIKAVLEETAIDLLVFCHDLRIDIVSNLEDYFGIQVMDRTNLILDIFESRARSREAILQISMARLKYNLPARLKDNDDDSHQRGGSAANRGTGERRRSLVKREYDKKILSIQRELDLLAKNKRQMAQKRKRSGLKQVAMVGYTNAGKSTLMNLILKKNKKDDKAVLARDQLFATLDASVRQVEHKGRRFLLTDTVGFVSNLPHELVDSFKSTLQACKDADLLVQVVDAANPYYDLQTATTIKTLNSIDAGGIEMITVFNKMDIAENHEQGLGISCKEDRGVDELLDLIISKLYPFEYQKEIRVPYDKLGILDEYRPYLDVVLIENREDHALYVLSGQQRLINDLEKKVS